MLEGSACAFYYDLTKDYDWFYPQKAHTDTIRASYPGKCEFFEISQVFYCFICNYVRINKFWGRINDLISSPESLIFIWWIKKNMIHAVNNVAYIWYKSNDSVALKHHAQRWDIQSARVLYYIYRSTKYIPNYIHIHNIIYNIVNTTSVWSNVCL